MGPLENIANLDNDFEVNELSYETPVGWSSICLDQTINYYIDCNSISIDEKNSVEYMNKDLT